MPHVIVKVWPGKSEAQKQDLTNKIIDAVTSALDYGEESVSVVLKEIPPENWKEQVYDPDIRQCEAATLYKKPGYTM